MLAGLRTATGTLTVVPVGRFEADPSAGAPWYPWMGWLFAAAALLIAAAGRLTGLSDALGSLLVGVLVVGTWGGLSRLIHWDGLADAVDGRLGGLDRQARLAIMRDSAVGAFGAFAIVAVFSLQVVSVALVYASPLWAALALAPVAGRLGAALAVHVLRPARPSGLGASAGARPPRAGWVWAMCALAPVPLVWGTGWPVLALGVLAIGSAVVVPYGWARPFGGYTGDTLGASILETETVVLVCAAILAAVGTAV